MSDLISRVDAIIGVQWAMFESISITRDDWNAIVEALKELPSAQPERKTGKWIFKNDLKQFFCNKCAEPSLTYDDIYIYGMDLPKFCPNCGSYNGGGQDG